MTSSHARPGRQATDTAGRTGRVPVSPLTRERPAPDRDARPGPMVSLDWYRTLPPGQPRRAFWAAAAGWALDAFDYQALPFALVGITAAFGLSNARAGLIATVTLVMSALGGVLAGTLADRIGRVRTLMLTVAVFSLFSVLSALAPSYGWLLGARALQGLGFGGEWGAGAVLIAEYCRPAQRGRVLGVVQSSWAVGWALAALAYTIVFSVAGQHNGWRVLFALGALPALLLVFLRRGLTEPEVFAEEGDEPARSHSLALIFRGRLLRRTVAASILAIGAQGGYYALFTWVPTFLKKSHHLKILGVGSYLFVIIAGAFLGYLVAGFLHDALGRRRTFALFALCSAVTVVVYTQVSSNGGSLLLLLLGLPLGFFPSGTFSGFGSYLAELYPTAVRGAGQGFCYNVGRGLGALFPYFIGLLSGSLGLAAAIALGASAYGLALVALAFLPETRGADLESSLAEAPAR